MFATETFFSVHGQPLTQEQSACLAKQTQGIKATGKWAQYHIPAALDCFSSAGIQNNRANISVSKEGLSSAFVW